MTTIRNAVSILFVVVLAAGGVAGCRKKPAPSPGSQPAAAEEIGQITMRGDPPEIIFPAALRADDPSLNKFIDDVLGYCVRGEYGRYRLAVANEYEPVPLQTFERAWRAVKEVRIRKIMRVHKPTTRQADPARTEVRAALKGMIYCVHATITLRDDRRTRPVREVVVLVIQEGGEWKLGPPAPAALKHEIMGTEASAEDMVNPAEQSEDDSASQPATTPSRE